MEEENEQVADDKKAVPEELDKVLEEEMEDDEEEEREEGKDGNEGEKDGEGGVVEGANSGSTKESLLSSKSDSKKRKGSPLVYLKTFLLIFRCILSS